MNSQISNQITTDLLNNEFGKGHLPEFFGIHFEEVGKDFVRASLVVENKHVRPGGIANGGVYLTLIETLGSVSASCVIDFQKFNALGIQVSANHTGVAMKGEKLSAVSKAVHIGRSTHIWEVNISNEKGKLLSSGRITMMIVPRQ